MLRVAIQFCALFSILCLASGEYTPDWESLDSRPLPEWYDDAKIGIFLHWGVYSVPSFGSEWFWSNWKGRDHSVYTDFMEQNYRPGFTYQDFGPEFRAELYDPDEWAELFASAGARYVILTSKHHEGFTMWPSKHSFGWNALDSGPNRDLLGDLAKSIRNRTPGIHFGLYYSLYEWFNPLYVKDRDNNFQTNNYVKTKAMPELHEITELYKPDIIWSDGDWEPQDWYWNSTTFLAWLFNDSPVKDTVVVNDRWGSGVLCKHGSFYTCTDHYNPGVLQDHKWENCMTLDKGSWGYNRRAKSYDYLSIEELLTEMAKTISCGGNLLVNTGPTPDGRIQPIMEERLRQMGSWLKLNGEAIYSSSPWMFQNDTTTSDVWYTTRSNFVYAIFLSWPYDEKIVLGSISEDSVALQKLTVQLIGYPDDLQFMPSSRGLEVMLPPLARVKGKWAWVLKIDGLK